MTSILFLTAAALALSGATYKAVGLRRRPSRPALVFAVTLYTLGLALTLRAPVIAQPTDALLRVPDLNLLVGNAVTLISACCIVTVVVYFIDPTGNRSPYKSRLWIILLVVTLTVMAGLFVWSTASHSGGFAELRSRGAHYCAYVLIYATYLAAAMVVCQLCLRHARHVADRYLRFGLHLVGIGSALGILYCVILAYHVITSPNTALGVVTSSLLPVGCCILLVTGSTVGGWGPWIGEWRDRLADYRSYRRLGTLWRALAEVAPEVIPPQDMARRLTISQKRYRRIIEIRDSILTLRAYHDPIIAEAVNPKTAELSLAEMAAMEARTIADAIQARHGGSRPTGRPAIAMPPQLGADLATESRWLEAVSAALSKALATSTERPTGMISTERHRPESLTWQDTMARVITDVLSPSVLMVIMLLVIGVTRAGGFPTGFLWGLAGAFFASIGPTAIIVMGVQRGRWSDRHLTERAHRRVPLIAAFVLVVLGVVLLVMLRAPKMSSPPVLDGSGQLGARPCAASNGAQIARHGPCR